MNKRSLALDILRGLTVAMMIIVNNPGSWSRIFPPLRHAPWEGCTPCDLVFPFFLFCVGASMAFALARYGSLTGEALRKVFRRGALLYLVGLLLAAFPFYPSPSRMDPQLSFWQNWLDWASGLRLVGVLARIAFCYVLGSVLILWLQRPWKIMCAFVAMALLHQGMLVAFADGTDPFALEGNFARKVDLAVLGARHMYHGYRNAAGEAVAFDPEGLWGILTGTCTVILGYFSGLVMRTSSREGFMTGGVARLLLMSALSLAAGLLLSRWIPFSKPLWSVSYVFYTAGWAMLLAAVLSYLVDVKGWEKPFLPFKALGMNALAIFVISGLLMKINWRFLHWDYTAVFGADEWMSLLFAVLYLLVHLALALVLYYRKIYIRL